ncbi:MAG: DUF6600 domain-containing protein [Acidobacteriota bacterium]
MKVAIILALLVGGSGVARADISVGVYANVPGDSVPSVDVFYDQLAPYGQWAQDPEVGTYVFLPNDRDYVPYTYGHWEYTDVGMMWVSSEPFAWATSHYGRWYYSDSLGRWAWLPDTEWGPSWVDWRESGDAFGWAPMPPQIIVDRGYREPVYAWHYAPAGRLYDPDLDRYYVPPRELPRFQRYARPVQQYGRWRDRRIVVGPPPALLRRHDVEVRPRRIEPRAMGRVNPGEYRQRPHARPQMQPRPQPRVQPTPRPRIPPQPRRDIRSGLEQRRQLEARPVPMQPRPVQPRPQPRPQPRAVAPRAVPPRAAPARQHPQPPQQQRGRERDHRGK